MVALAPTEWPAVAPSSRTLTALAVTRRHVGREGVCTVDGGRDWGQCHKTQCVHRDRQLAPMLCSRGSALYGFGAHNHCDQSGFLSSPSISVGDVAL